jgi:ribosomal protein L37AE/L43A
VTAAGWIDRQRRTVGEIAAQLGREGSDRKGYPCPACNEEHRDRRRGAVFVGRDGAWRCYRCGACGDGLDYLSFALVGKRLREASAEERATVRDWCGEAPAPRPAPAPRAPVYADVSAFWSACYPCPSGDPFMAARRLVPSPDLARFTPPTADGWPEWWPPGRAKVWRLVTRGWAPTDGGMAAVNLHGRAVVDPPEFDGRKIKTLWAKGLSSEGVVMWNLRDVSDARLVLVTEGLTDWLAASCWADERPGVVVFGMTSGGAAAFARIHIPTTADLIIATDDDDAGDKYASDIAQHYTYRRVHRAHPSRFGVKP